MIGAVLIGAGLVEHSQAARLGQGDPVAPTRLAQADIDAQAELEASDASLEVTESDAVVSDWTHKAEPDVVDVTNVAPEIEAAPADEHEDTVSDDTTEETN